MADKKPWEDYQEESGPWSDYSASAEEVTSEGFFGKGLLKGTLQALPAAGAMFGGAAGTMAGPIGTLGGAGLGAAAGKAAQNLGEKYLLGEEKTREDIYGGPAKEAIAGATAEAGGQLIGPAIKGIGTLTKKAASSFSSIPEKTLETYFNRGKDVEGLISKYGADTQESANALRQDINKSVGAFKSQQNAKISNALTNKTDLIDVNPAIDTLKAMRDKLDPDFNPDKIALISEQIDRLTKVAPQGTMPISKAYAAKQSLQEMSDYLEPGQFFKKKGLVDVAFEKAAKSINDGVKAAAPEIKEADKNLYQLRRATKNLNRNLLKEGATEASLVQAAQGTNQNALGLRKLEGLTGKEIMPQIEDIAAQKAFAEPSLLPNVATGAKLVPLILGGGYAGREALEGDYSGAAQGLLAASLGSPMALKYGIKAARPLLKGGGYLMPYIKELPKAAVGR